jgi:hypothetical protein
MPAGRTVFSSGGNPMSAEWMRYTARALVLTWAGWWMFFGLASGTGERLSPLGVLLHAAVPGGIFLISALIAWRWEMPGAALLIVEGLIVCAGYPLMVSGRFPLATILFVLLTMALPPVLAGLLFLAGWRRSPA